MTRSVAPIFWCLIAAALFGASTPASKTLLGAVGPLTLAGLLYLGAALAVLPLSFSGGSRTLRREPRNRLRVVTAVFFGGGVAPVLLLLGLARAPAASVALWLNLETVATAVLAWVYFREHLETRTWVGLLLLTVAGVLLAAPLSVGTASAAALVTAACLAWGVDNNLTALVDGFTPAQYTLIKGLVAGSVNLSLGMWREPTVSDWHVAAGALGVGAVGYGLSLMLYVGGAQHLGATRSQMLFATSPFLGSVLAWTAFGEPVQPVQLVAALVMAAGVAVVLSSRHGHEHTHEGMIHTHSHRHDEGHHRHRHPGQPVSLRHTHPHRHEPLVHTHPHASDLHHRHEH